MNLQKFNTTLRAIALGLLLSSLSAQAYIIHEVKRSETLWGIAHHYGVNPEDLVKANPKAERGIKNGMRLLIPEKSDLKKLNSGIVETIDGLEAPSAPKAVSIKDKDKDKAQEPATTKAGRATKIEAPASTPETVLTEKTTAETPLAVETAPVYSIAKEERTEAAPIEPADDGQTYTAKFGDSLRSIAQKTGVSEDDLLKYNIFIDPNNLPEGYVIRLSADAPMVAPMTPVNLVDSIVYNIEPQTAIEDQTISVQAKGNVVAVMLPFDVEGETISRQSLLATDFYKGLLLAAKEATANSDMPLKIIAIDTHCSPSDFDNRLQALKAENVSIIIPPEDEQQLEKIQRFAIDNNALVLNILNIKDEGYKRYPNVLQSNISQKLMYEKAINSLLSDYADFTPVVLDLAGGKDEKASFVDELKRQYEQKGKKVINLSFKNMLEQSDIAQLPDGGKYLFITKSGSADVFSRVSETLINTVEGDVVNEHFKVFGYPDWITFRGDQEEALHRMGASIYSRFYMNESDPLTEEVTKEYINWYGNPMEEVYPSQGMLGYDTGRMLFNKLSRAKGNDLLDTFSRGTNNGIQSTFHFVKEDTDSPTSGMVNDALYIIEFMPGGLHYVKVL